MKLSEHFTLEELTRSATAKARGIDNTPTERDKANLKRLAAEVLEPLRKMAGVPIIVTSGFRCPKLNAAVGGEPTSQHMRGEAADIKCADNRMLFAAAMELMLLGKIKVGQLIDEKKYAWLHISLPTLAKNNQVMHL